MRSSSGAPETVAVAKTVNGRFSEAQAAIALMNLEDFAAHRLANEELHRDYQVRLGSIPGLHLVKPSGISLSNFQCAVCRVDKLEYGLSRDALIALLAAENVFAQPVAEHPGRLNGPDILTASCIQLPIGACMTAERVERVCALLAGAHREATAIRARLDLG